MQTKGLALPHVKYLSAAGTGGNRQADGMRHIAHVDNVITLVATLLDHGRHIEHGVLDQTAVDRHRAVPRQFAGRTDGRKTQREKVESKGCLVIESKTFCRDFGVAVQR